MPKDAAFWQFLYLIFCKMHDEREHPGQQRQFWAGPREQFDEEGQRAIRTRIMPLFTEVKQRYQSIFRGSEEITLSDRALAFMVSELAKYDFSRTDVDAKGAAYQEIVGANLRGDRGQYFTPRGAIRLAVQMLDPQEHERVLDPACGTAGFLVATLGYCLDKFRDEQAETMDPDSSDAFQSRQSRLRQYAKSRLFGADFDPFLIRASQMNMIMAGDGQGHLYNINSLEFPFGHLADLTHAQEQIPLGSLDIVMTNPPFGADIPITDPNILKHFELAYMWDKLDDGSFRNRGKLQGTMAPEVLFIERCVKWLKPGGRLGMVVPNGILGNPKDEYIRWWILRHTWLLASVELPVEVFIVEANVNVQTSLLFLRRKTDAEIRAEDLGGRVEYPVFMAVAEKVGFDRRGNKVYKRTADGEDIIELHTELERLQIGGRVIERSVSRRQKVIDDDLPEIAQRYRTFLKEQAGMHAHLADL
jgi:type I restriction enzyme M protein